MYLFGLILNWNLNTKKWLFYFYIYILFRRRFLLLFVPTNDNTNSNTKSVHGFNCFPSIFCFYIMVFFFLLLLLYSVGLTVAQCWSWSLDKLRFIRTYKILFITSIALKKTSPYFIECILLLDALFVIWSFASLICSLLLFFGLLFHFLLVVRQPQYFCDIKTSINRSAWIIKSFNIFPFASSFFVLIHIFHIFAVIRLFQSSRSSFVIIRNCVQFFWMF